jgi:hypothetical protein
MKNRENKKKSAICYQTFKSQTRQAKKQADTRGRIRTYKKRRASPGGDTLPREDGTDLQEEESLS